MVDSTQGNNKSGKKKKRGLGRILLAVFILIPLVLLIIISLLGYLRYRSWRNDFHKSIGKDYVVVDIEEFKYESERSEIDEKVEGFLNSKEEVSFIQLTTKESAILISDGIAGSLPDTLGLNKLYLDPDEGEWDIYVQLDFNNINLPIFQLEIAKDNVQSVEVFVRDIYFAGANVDNLGLGELKHSINEGYREAIFSVNENRLTSHRFENIELEEDELVIKGEKNEYQIEEL